VVYIHRLHKFGTQKTYKAALWRLDILICIDINKYFRLKPRIYHPVDGWRHLIRTRAELLNNKLLITMISKIFENFDPKWKYIFSSWISMSNFVECWKWREMKKRLRLQELRSKTNHLWKVILVTVKSKLTYVKG